MQFIAVGGARRMLEINATAGRLGTGRKMFLDGLKVIGITAAVGIEIHDYAVFTEPTQRLVHSDLACKADPGMLRRQIGNVDHMRVFSRLGCGFAIALLQVRLRIHGGIDDDNDFDCPAWAFTGAQRFQRGEKVRLVETRDDHDDAQTVRWWLVNLPPAKPEALKVGIDSGL